MCATCGHQVSVTAGTIFQDTRTPLTLWFRAIWWVVSQKPGASALGLQRVLGLGSYRTAWTWLHKLRRLRRDLHDGIGPTLAELHALSETLDTVMGIQIAGELITRITGQLSTSAP